MILKGVDHYRVCEAMFEGMRVIMSYRGEAYSPAYIQGTVGRSVPHRGHLPVRPQRAAPPRRHKTWRTCWATKWRRCHSTSRPT